MTHVPHRPPLHVHLLFHPRSDAARALAEALATQLMAPPASQGLRLPVFLSRDPGGDLPPPIDWEGPTDDPNAIHLDGAEHTLLVVLVDGRMARRVKGGTGDAWGRFLAEAIDRLPPGRQHHVLPVALDRAAFGIDDDAGEHHFLPLDRTDDAPDLLAHLTFHVAVRALLLMQDGEVPGGAPATISAPVHLFLSHAKRDLDGQREDVVGAVQDQLKELPVQGWFDAKNIPPGARFSQAIEAGIDASDLVVVFVTDAWASRPWCRREATYAKSTGKPILVVYALREGEARSFPHGGNVRTLSWRAGLGPLADDDATGRLERQARYRAEADRVIAAAVQEALRRTHARESLDNLAGPDDFVLAAAPEPIDLAVHGEAECFLYPDPPLGQGERDVLSALRPGARFETPMTRVAAAHRAPDGESPLVALSISDSETLRAEGLTPRHLRTLSDEILLYLLLGGVRIVYGGKLNVEKPNDSDNFTLRLFDLVGSYGDLARNAGVSLAPILNTPPWPLWHLYGDDVLELFGRVAELEEVPRAPGLPFTDAELGTLPNGFVPPVSPLQRYAWARSITHMRDVLTARCAARVCMGGKIEGYKGRMAGLIEEPLLSLAAGKPLFLAGALGGCARLVVDLLEGRERPEMTTAAARSKVDDYDDIVALYAEHGGTFLTREEVAAQLAGFGAAGPAAALNNGLNDGENRELFRCSDPRRVAQLVLVGLQRLRDGG